MKYLAFFSLMFTILIFSSCASKGGSNPSLGGLVGGASTKIIELEPDWWSNLDPRDSEYEGYEMAKGEGRSNSKRGARSKAVSDLVGEFRQKAKILAEGRTEDFFKETGEDVDANVQQSFSEIQNTIWSGSVEGWREFKSTTVVEESVDRNGNRKNIYRHYIIGGIDLGRANRKLMAKLKSEEALMIEFEKTKAYDKLQADLERYKDRLKD